MPLPSETAPVTIACILLYWVMSANTIAKQRQCLGINLANAELYLTLATIFRRFDIELYETTARDAEIAHDYFVPHGHADSKGVRVIFK